MGWEDDRRKVGGSGGRGIIALGGEAAPGPQHFLKNIRNHAAPDPKFLIHKFLKYMIGCTELPHDFDVPWLSWMLGPLSRHL